MTKQQLDEGMQREILHFTEFLAARMKEREEQATAEMSADDDSDEAIRARAKEYIDRTTKNGVRRK